MRRLLVVLSVILLAWPLAALAQSNATDGALDGFVRDPNGATVPAAQVIALNLGTNQVARAVSMRRSMAADPFVSIEGQDAARPQERARGSTDSSVTLLRTSIASWSSSARSRRRIVRGRAMPSSTIDRAHQGLEGDHALIACPNRRVHGFSFGTVIEFDADICDCCTLGARCGGTTVRRLSALGAAPAAGRRHPPRRT